jgi:hypothetical protein
MSDLIRQAAVDGCLVREVNRQAAPAAGQMVARERATGADDCA